VIPPDRIVLCPVPADLRQASRDDQDRYAFGGAVEGVEDGAVSPVDGVGVVLVESVEAAPGDVAPGLVVDALGSAAGALGAGAELALVVAAALAPAPVVALDATSAWPLHQSLRARWAGEAFR
jgi:hypothetical protein